MGAHYEVVESWVVRNGLKPEFKVGDRVKVPHRAKSEPVVGDVYEIDAKRAQYRVYVESLGHVREGNGTHGLIIGFEDAKAV